MKILDANDWEYIEAKKKAYIEKLRTKNATKGHRRKSKKHKINIIAAANRHMKSVAEKNARKMRKSPSELEKRMQEFLNGQDISYDFQKIFYLKDTRGKIFQFFIADFYVPDKNLIVETDGKFHEDQKEYDEWRTEAIKEYYPHTDVIRWKWGDFNSYTKRKDLVSKLKS